jgi:hypothetical protein
MTEENSDEKPVIKIQMVEQIDSAGRRISRPGGANVIYLYQTSNQQDEAVTVSPYRPAEPALRWRLQVVADNQHCQIINQTSDDDVRIDLGVAESNNWKILKADQYSGEQLSDAQTLQVNYEYPIWINHKIGLVFYRRLRGESIEVELRSDDGTELTERHTRAAESPDRQDHPLKWLVKLRHKSPKDATVQFHLSLAVGRLSRSAYRLDSLYLNLNRVDPRDVSLIFFQSLAEPVEAGDYLIAITAGADEYPNEIARDFQILRVVPFYDHKLDFENDDAQTTPTA